MGRIFCLDCSRRELEWCKYCCRAREVREAGCHNHTYTECTICGHLHVDVGKDVVEKCLHCLQIHCTNGCMAQCNERIKLEKRLAESDKLYYEYENVVGLFSKNTMKANINTNVRAGSTHLVNQWEPRTEERIKEQMSNQKENSNGDIKCHCTIEYY